MVRRRVLGNHRDETQNVEYRIWKVLHMHVVDSIFYIPLFVPWNLATLALPGTPLPAILLEAGAHLVAQERLVR